MPLWSREEKNTRNSESASLAHEGAAGSGDSWMGISEWFARGSAEVDSHDGRYQLGTYLCSR